MKLINLFIRELENCGLGGDFRVSRHAEICQFDRFSLEIIFKRGRTCNYGSPRLVQVKMKILYKNQNEQLKTFACFKPGFQLDFFAFCCSFWFFVPTKSHNEQCDAQMETSTKNQNEQQKAITSNAMLKWKHPQKSKTSYKKP